MTRNPHFLIAVLGFDRPSSLSRLLNSLKGVESTDCGADLLISIDGGGNPSCIDVANAMVWEHGNLRVIQQPKNLGLKEHVERTTDLVEDYDGIIILEDDLSVSSELLNFCSKAHEYYGAKSEIAQISLYSPSYNPFGLTSFVPAKSKFDLYFCRVPSSWGQFYTRDSWQSYRNWRKRTSDVSTNSAAPSQIDGWRYSWKKDFFHYVSSQKKWVAHPYTSFSTNHGEIGTNYRDSTKLLEVPMEYFRRSYHFGPIDECALYDEWYQPTHTMLKNYGFTFQHPFDVDLLGYKPFEEVKSKYLLSTRNCAKPILQYSSERMPLEMNLLTQNQPDVEDRWKISLGAIENFEEEYVGGRYFLQFTSLPHDLYRDGQIDGIQQVKTSFTYRVGEIVCRPFKLFKNR